MTMMHSIFAEMTEGVESALKTHGYKKEAKGRYRGPSPFRADSDSDGFTVNLTDEDNGKIGWYDHVQGIGGKIEDLAKLFNVPIPKADDGKKTTYDYRDVDDTLLYQVHITRYPNGDKKTFQSHICPDGKRTWTLGGNSKKCECPKIPMSLYHLRELVQADPSQPVLVVEGEKDVETARKLGVVATCNSGGASKNTHKSKWDNLDKSLLYHFSGLNVIVIADNDEPGIAHADSIANSLLSIAKSIKVIRFNGPQGYDFTDYIEGGGTWESFLKLVETVEPRQPITPAMDNTQANGHSTNVALEEAKRYAEEQREAAEPIQADPWQIFTLEDAFKPRPPKQQVVDGILTLPSLNIVYGPPGSLKTLLLQDMGACVASGKGWLKNLPNAQKSAIGTMQAGVMWIDLDNGRRLMHERFEAVARGKDLDPSETPLYYVSMPDPWLNASDQDHLDALGQRIERLGVRLLFIDNLGVVLGDVDENSGSMSQVMG